MKKRNMKKDLFKLCKKNKKDKLKNKNCNDYNCGGGVYFVGFIGAAVYYIQQSATFWQGDRKSVV